MSSARPIPPRQLRRPRRRRFLLHSAVIALAALPQVALLFDVVEPRAGLPPTALVLLALQVPAVIELLGLGRDRDGGLVALLAWHLFYVAWLTSIGYAIPAGLLRIALLALDSPAAALAPLPLGVAAVPLALATFGVFVGQHRVRTRVVEVDVPGLPPALAGLRIVQLTDLHVGRFLGRARLAGLVRRALEAQPDLVVITGDVLDESGHFAGLAADGLGWLNGPGRPRLGVYACLGNHDHYAGASALRLALEARGIRVLVNEAETLRLPGGKLLLAGVDDLWFGADLDAALELHRDGVPTVLLSHQPNIFPEAASRGVALTISGHTHGGQVALPGFPQLSLARLITPYPAGLYRAGVSRLFVSRGAGSIRPLVRLGAPPELCVLVLTPAPAVATERAAA